MMKAWCKCCSPSIVKDVPYQRDLCMAAETYAEKVWEEHGCPEEIVVYVEKEGKRYCYRVEAAVHTEFLGFRVEAE